MVVDVKQFEMLATYLDAVSFLMQMNAANEVVTDAHTSVVTFRHGLSMREENFSSHL